WAALGSIEDGQDPNVTGTIARQRRSGQAPHTLLHYYRGKPGLSNPTFTATAIEAAVAAGAKLVNVSFELGSTCAASQDLASLNGIIRSATSAGTLVVKSAGNAPPGAS